MYSKNLKTLYEIYENIHILRFASNFQKIQFSKKNILKVKKRQKKIRKNK